METKKYQINETTLVKSLKLMFKDMKSGKTIYLAFSKKSFHILVFVMGMSIVANIALISLLINAPTIVERTNPSMYIAQLILSGSAILGGLWLFLKGVNIITDK